MANGDMKEVADEFLQTNGLPEAPASATIRVWIDGYGVLLTMRSDKVGDVVEKLEYIVKKAKEKGWKPSWKDEKEDKAQPSYTCSICGAPAEYKSGVKNGRKWAGIFCTANKEHVRWLKTK